MSTPGTIGTESRLFPRPATKLAILEHVPNRERESLTNILPSSALHYRLLRWEVDTHVTPDRGGLFGFPFRGPGLVLLQAIITYTQ